MKEKKTLRDYLTNIKDYISNIPKGVKTAIAVGTLLGMVSTIGLPQAYARDPQIEIKNKGTIIMVKGYAPGGRDGIDYIGMTVDTNHNGRLDIDDYNFEPIEVPRGEFREGFSLSRLFTGGWDSPSISGGERFTVALWDRRVDNCGCEWCEKEGYHLEGELARDYDKVW